MTQQGRCSSTSLSSSIPYSFHTFPLSLTSRHTQACACACTHTRAQPHHTPHTHTHEHTHTHTHTDTHTHTPEAPSGLRPPSRSTVSARRSKDEVRPSEAEAALVGMAALPLGTRATPAARPGTRAPAPAHTQLQNVHLHCRPLLVQSSLAVVNPGAA